MLETVSLAKYDAACAALSAAKSIDEVKAVRDTAEAMRAYARQAKNKQLEIDAAEIRIRAERRVGELMQAQRETVGVAKGGQPYQRSTGSESDPVEDQPVPTLEEAGIDKHLADRARKLAAVPEEQFEQLVDDWRGRTEAEPTRVLVDVLAPKAHVSNNSGDNEWYTPQEWIEALRDALRIAEAEDASHVTIRTVIEMTRRTA